MSPNIAPKTRRRWALSVEGETRHAFEHHVSGEQRRADVNCRSSDPEVVGVDRLVERMSDLAACVTQLRCGGQQGIAHWDDGGRCDRLLQPLSALVSPAGDECAVAELRDGDRCEEHLMSGHEPDLWFEAGASAPADGRAEDAGVDEDPHDSRAAAKASSSSSERSSTNRSSIESSTGAASS